MTRIADMNGNGAVLKAALEATHRRVYLHGIKPRVRMFDLGIIEAFRTSMEAGRPWVVTLRNGYRSAVDESGILRNQEGKGS